MMYGIILLLLFQLSWSLPNITIPEGSSFTLPCQQKLPDDLFFLKFNWTFTPEKDGQDLRHDHLNRLEEQLKLNDVELKDAGKYTCIMEGRSGDGLMKLERSFTLHIQEIPLLMKRLVVTVMEKEEAMLPCRAAVTSWKADSARPSWHRVMEGSAQQELHPGFKIQSSSSKEDMASDRIYWTSDPKEQDWSITIASVRLDDSGLYNCAVHGAKEKEIVSVQLIVDSPHPLCPDHSQAWEACPDPDNRSWKATVSEALTAFSVNVYSTLKKTHATHNMLFSPASIGGLLSYLLLGARGKTRPQLESALSLPTEFSCIHEMMRNIRNETKESMHMAYKMFYNPVYELRETFISQSLEFYGTQPGKLTNSSEKNVKMVNDWVANMTHNRITKLLDSVEEDTQVVLLSAVYFSGKWKSSFNVKTKLDNFTTLSGEKVSVPVLYSSRFELAVSYKTFLKAQVARFPLKGKSSLYIVLPTTRSEQAFTLVEDSLTETNVRTMVTEMESLPLVSSEVTLPKIKLTLNTDLISLLKKLGLFDLLDDPDLCGMISGKSAMLLTDARHRAYMSLTEKGVEAAAASSISFSRSFSTFSAMKPFIFIVWSEVSKCPLFMGRVLNPQYKD